MSDEDEEVSHIKHFINTISMPCTPITKTDNGYIHCLNKLEFEKWNKALNSRLWLEDAE